MMRSTRARSVLHQQAQAEGHPHSIAIVLLTSALNPVKVAILVHMLFANLSRRKLSIIEERWAEDNASSVVERIFSWMNALSFIFVVVAWVLPLLCVRLGQKQLANITATTLFGMWFGDELIGGDSIPEIILW